MPLWLFAVVWLAAWAVAWWWPWPYRVGAAFGTYRPRATTARFRSLLDPPRLAPLVATAVTFAVEAAWLVLS